MFIINFSLIYMKLQENDLLVVYLIYTSFYEQIEYNMSSTELREMVGLKLFQNLMNELGISSIVNRKLVDSDQQMSHIVIINFNYELISQSLEKAIHLRGDRIVFLMLD